MGLELCISSTGISLYVNCATTSVHSKLKPTILHCSNSNQLWIGTSEVVLMSATQSQSGLISLFKLGLSLQ